MFSLFRILWSFSHLYFFMRALETFLREGHITGIPYRRLFAAFSLIPWHVHLLWIVLYVFCMLCCLIGYRTRIAQVLLALVSLVLLLNSASIYSNHIAFIVGVDLALIFAATEQFWSMDAQLKFKKNETESSKAWSEKHVSYFAQRLILVQTSFLYFFAAASKVSTDWFSRQVNTNEFLHLLSTQDGPGLTIWTKIMEHGWMWLPIAMVPITLIVLSVGIHVAARFPLFAVCGILFHVFLAFQFPNSGVQIFSMIMIMVWMLAMEKVERTTFS